jgi:membrane-associated phospholipid phosphatase
MAMAGRLPFDRRLWFVVISLAIAGIAALALDIPVTLFLKAKPLHKELARILNLAEIGGHGTGAAMILIGALVIARPNWRRFSDRLLALRLIGGTYLGGLIVDIFKLLIPRVRPHSAMLESSSQAMDTFGRQLLEAGSHSRSALMSFPSGHAAVAFGLAASLSWYFPAGRPAFIALAILASLQRLFSGAHYLSDICIGAGLGLVGAWLCMPKPEARDFEPMG